MTTAYVICHRGTELLPFALQLCPQLQAARGVHLAYSCRGTAGWRQAKNLQALDTEVIVPGLHARVEKRGDLSGLIIDACQIGSFVKAASVAGQREIGGIIASIVLAGTNVIDVKRSERRIRLTEPTILTAIFCTLPHKSTSRTVHQNS